MATPPKPTGDIVRGLSADADVELARAKQILFEAITGGSPDPVVYIRAIGKALKVIEAAHVATRSIHNICEKDALRGPYNNRDE